MKMSNTKMVNIRLPVDIKEQLRVAALEDSRSISGLITAIIKTWLKDNADKAA